ncbi:hypothetical protein T265_09111 [Opisthorchis viverrini]|uniref:Uncharacterized protein n=1 Tax=Opisthorchis viverrini TaxID=6198 RepID=A0A074ZHW4_OPIVI|nr:hypothetical protein T265_09111 [Opisthorchis viverrini]KER22875.1 hypothetical protein T265_09111 [Opisthorchis viverrini]
MLGFASGFFYVIIIIIIIINDSMTSVFNTNASLPYSHDLFESLIMSAPCDEQMLHAKPMHDERSHQS